GHGRDAGAVPGGPAGPAAGSGGGTREPGGRSAPLREGVTPSPADEVLARFFAAGQQYSAVPGHGQLWSALADATSGGKAFRPELFHSVYLGLGGTDQVIAANVAAALELLHTALVVHDDVIDGDTIRRGRPNVAGTFAATARARGHREARARHFGDTAAILAGDLALVGAVRTLAGSGADPATTTRMLDLLDEAVHVSAAGELTDVRLSMEGCADVAEAITMAYHKTAVYSFGLPLRLAAVLSGQERYEEVLTEY